MNNNISNIYIFYRNKFGSEYKSFVDGIVGATFEYVCQFIIKNSMDNIKRTQSALNYFSLSNNISKYLLFSLVFFKV